MSFSTRLDLTKPDRESTEVKRANGGFDVVIHGVFREGGQVASGNHCKTLETTVETSAWQP
ncbi:hypothetical protein AH14b_p25 (endogenous virus) [Pseudomonas phage phiAH14b]|nr:hypothetical protein AH14b_p25 [Pseudomonas phage phiAH14b]